MMRRPSCLAFSFRIFRNNRSCPDTLLLGQRRTRIAGVVDIHLIRAPLIRGGKSGLQIKNRIQIVRSQRDGNHRERLIQQNRPEMMASPIIVGARHVHQVIMNRQQSSRLWSGDETRETNARSNRGLREKRLPRQSAVSLAIFAPAKFLIRPERLARGCSL